MPVTESALSQIKALQPYTAGKPVEELERELGISNSIKLASNENPLGCSPRAQKIISQQLNNLWLYPDANAYYLKQALAEKLGLEAERFTIGNGSNDVLDMVARTFLKQGKEAIFSQYAFIVYPIVTQACGAEARIIPALARDSEQPYGHDLDAMLQQINEHTAVIFIANPNNPTGTWLQEEHLLDFIKKVPEHIAIVIDEAYFEYVEFEDYPDTSKWLNDFANLIVTRTFSKIYGLAGLRLGYAMSSEAVCDLLNRVRQPFNANLLALSAGIESLQDEVFVSDSIQNNRQGLHQLVQFCEHKSLFYIPSAGNFLTVEFSQKANQIYQQLLQRGIIVRPIANYGLDDFLRISIGSETQIQRLITALDELL